MSLARRLQRWWDDLLGRPSWYRDPDHTTTGSGMKPGSTAKKATPTDELTLVDDPRETGPKSRRSAGVDPYSNDAGYSKPHSWERLDHD